MRLTVVVSSIKGVKVGRTDIRLEELVSEVIGEVKRKHVLSDLKGISIFNVIEVC
jgi:hypothetical protein